MQRISWMVFLCVFAGGSLFGQATRTWVSGVGDDANPCSRTAPCKTFAGAISKTVAGGEINVIDSGAYGTLTITKAITIDGAGSQAGVLSSLVNGFVVNAGPSDVVTLRNLDVHGAGNGLNGIRFLNGKALHVENLLIYNFAQKGISFEPSGPSLLTVRDTVIRNNNNPTNGGGLFVKPGVAGAAEVFLNGVHLIGNHFGIRAEDGTRLTATNSSAVASTSNGFLAFSTAGAISMSLEGCTAASNGNSGVRAVGANAFVRIANLMIANNGVGISTQSNGNVISFQNNRNGGNALDGAPTGTQPQQ